jgi:membrane-associated phospholipid phosphatase
MSSGTDRAEKTGPLSEPVRTSADNLSDHAEHPEQAESSGTVGASDGAAAEPWRGWLAPIGRLLPTWITPGRIGFGLYLAVLIWYCLTEGVPIDRIGQTVWIVAGILAAGLGRTWRQHVRVFLDWIPLLAALVLYDHTRGIADTLGMTVRVGELVRAEEWLFFGELPTVWLQERLYDAAQVRWWDVPVALVYMAHFILPWAIAAVFYFRSRPLWVRYIRRVLLLSYAGLLTYILLPAAPPWYAARVGEIDGEVVRNSTRGWWELGLSFADVMLKDAQAQSNQVAALPSLHAAFALLSVVALWPIVGRLSGTLLVGRLPLGTVLGVGLRVILVLFPLAMCFTLVYSGEHYVVDVLAGWLYVVLVCFIARWWERRASAWFFPGSERGSRA